MRENLLLSLMLAACAGAVSAQTSTAFKEQFKLIKAPNAIASVGADLFGDKVNLYSGALEFIQNDVSLTGNNKLQVMIGRRLTAGQFAFDDRAFGKWNLEIPHLHGVFASDGFTNRPGWVGRDGSNSRCTKFGAPTEATGLQGPSKWHSSEFWRGNYLYVPGHGDQQMLRRAPGYARKPSSVRLDDTTEVKDFPIVTSAHWAVGCLTRLKNSSLGEGFLVIAPDGTKYVFDWLVNYKATTLTKSTNWPPQRFCLSQTVQKRSLSKLLTSPMQAWNSRWMTCPKLCPVQPCRALKYGFCHRKLSTGSAIPLPIRTTPLGPRTSPESHRAMGG